MRFIANTSDIEKYLGVKINEHHSIKNISTDTRFLKKDSIFFAIKGENFNGNDYVEEALNKGAVIAVADDTRFANSKEEKIIYVKDTTLALAKISSNIIKDFDGKVIAITGSNGKTTTTNIISKTLKHSSSTLENFNNEIGMPLSVLNASPKAKQLVLEIGASKFKDIDYLSKILNPHIGVITNIGNSHLEQLKNIKGVLKVKSEIIKNIKSNGFLVVPNENKKHLDYWKKIRRDIKIITFGMSKDADFYASKIKIKHNGTNFHIVSKLIDEPIQIKTSFEGTHNIKNILASCVTNFCLNKKLNGFAKSLNSNEFKITRQNKLKWLKGSTLIDDTYNANPDSTKKSIDLLSNYKKKTILILGDMLELGRYTKKLHKEVGEYANAKGIDLMLGYGDTAKYAINGFGKNGIYFRNEDDLKDYLKENVSSKDVILIKGSRGMRMERFINV